MPRYRNEMVLCSHFEYPIMWLRTSLLHFALSDAILKNELSAENTAVDCPDLTKIVCTAVLGAHFSAQVQGLDLVLGSDTGTVPEF